MDAKIPFDKRIDEIGNAEDFVKAFVKDRRSGLKLALVDKGADRAEGETHQAQIIESETRQIDAAALLKMYEKGEIKKAEFISAIKASPDKCEEFLSRTDVERISTRTAATSLRITPKTKAPFDLVLCLKKLCGFAAA